jgi:hypothetical protein
VFNNIFNTIIDVKGKTKDNIKAKMDLSLYCNYENIELVNDGFCVAKPKATFIPDSQ